MTEDEKLVEKVAEAMIVDADAKPHLSWQEFRRAQARAAISAVREHDKEKGLVYVDQNALPPATKVEFFKAGTAEFIGAVSAVEPAASREPDLPSSLTAPHRHMKGGIQG